MAHSSGRVNEVLQRSLLNARSHAYRRRYQRRVQLQELLPEVVYRLKESGDLEESDGADVVFPGGWVNRDGEPLPMIIRKADGGYNYSTSDLACIIDRVERLGCDGFLYVVGTPQKQHFEMVFQVAKKAGFMSHNHQAVHVNFGSVLDTDGKVLKSREGEVIKLHDLLEEAIRRAKQSIDDKNPDLLGKERKKSLERWESAL